MTENAQINTAPRVVILDVETTSINDDPSPYNPDNKLLWVGVFDGSTSHIWDIEFSGAPYGDALANVQAAIDESDLVVGFALKFDLSYLRRYGIRLPNKILDLQSAEFIINGQRDPQSSLDEALSRYGLPLKIPFDFHESHTEEQWRQYLGGDLDREWKLYQSILGHLQNHNDPRLKRLVYDDSQDQLITLEMEANGLKYDLEKSKAMGDRILSEVQQIDNRLRELAPHPAINWASPDHKSAVLFGGVIKYDERESYTRTLKDGTVKTKEHWVTKEAILPRLVTPLEKSEVKKDGYFQTGEGILLKLRASGAAKEIITNLLQRVKLTKLVGTYYHGIPERYAESNWSDSIIHGQLHHCVARTGRLSSSKPNLQNVEDSVRQCIVSRFS